jgi:nucleotide-binding universal stress UspA family protein
VLQRARQTLADVVTPDQLEPAPGQWRAERVQARSEDQLFLDILLPVDGSTSAWCAVEQAMIIAQREKGRLYGLYIAPSEAKQEMENAVREEFARRCDGRSVAWKWITEGGDAERVIVERAHWADLIVLGQQGQGPHPPERVLSSTFQAVMLRATRPVLVVVDTCSLLRKALLAYDGSPESEEALFVAAYVGQKWGLPLTVVTVEESHRADEGTLRKALTYLNEQGAQAEALLRQGDVPEAILAAVQECGCDWLIMGGSGYSPFRALFTRSTVTRVIREAPCPVLICR